MYFCLKYLSHKMHPNLKVSPNRKQQVLNLVALCIHVYLTYPTSNSHGLYGILCYII